MKHHVFLTCFVLNLFFHKMLKTIVFCFVFSFKLEFAFNKNWIDGSQKDNFPTCPPSFFHQIGFSKRQKAELHVALWTVFPSDLSCFFIQIGISTHQKLNWLTSKRKFSHLFPLVFSSKLDFRNAKKLNLCQQQGCFFYLLPLFFQCQIRIAKWKQNVFIYLEGNNQTIFLTRHALQNIRCCAQRVLIFVKHKNFIFWQMFLCFLHCKLFELSGD